MSTKPTKLDLSSVKNRIHSIRGQRIVLDKDLAELYGVTTYRLNEQVKRNRKRFPEDFLFQLTNQEVVDLRSQFAISKGGRGGQRYLPYAFTEHGAVMVATVLNSKIAIEMSILVVRAFIELREMLREHADLKQRLQAIEARLSKGFAEHEQELQEIRFLISQLEQSPPMTKKRRIGF
jgi:phage regulator Rha-like protein